MLLKFRYLMARGEDFSIETTLATRSLLNMVRKAQQQGYDVTVLYFWLNSPELAIKRVRDRVAAGGHNIQENVIRRRYWMGLNYLFKDYMQACDRCILADNSKIPFTVIAEGSSSMVHIKDSEKYDITWAIAHPAPSEDNTDNDIR